MATRAAQKGLRIATSCKSLDDFVTSFHGFCEKQSIFIATTSSHAVGSEIWFSIELTNGTAALRGGGTVVAAWTTDPSPYRRPGLKVAGLRLTTESMRTFERLVASAAGDFRAGTEDTTNVLHGGDDGLTKVFRGPASPLTGVTEEMLDGLVDEAPEKAPTSEAHPVPKLTKRRLTERVQLGISRLPVMRQRGGLKLLGAAALLVGIGIAAYFVLLREDSTAPSADVAAPATIDAAPLEPEPSTTMQLRDEQTERKTRHREKPKWDPNALFPPKPKKR